jgi:hypothetical protein
MRTDLTATVIDGTLKLDEPLPWPDDSRVRVTIESIGDSNQDWFGALEALDRLRRERPIRAGGLRFTRDQLHERH